LACLRRPLARALDLASRRATSTRAQLHPERRATRDRIAPHRPDPGRYGGIAKHCYSRHAWRSLLEQLQPFFAPKPYSYAAKPVMLPPGRAKLSTKARADWGRGTPANTIGTVRVARCNGPDRRTARGEDHVRRKRDQFPPHIWRVSSSLPPGPAVVDLNVVPDGPTQLLQPLRKMPRCEFAPAGRSRRTA